MFNVADEKQRKTISQKQAEMLVEWALERYRSGHNEAVLKTVCLHGHEGSNPSLSAVRRKSECTLTT